jgi:WD40 repeat protein
MSNSTLYSYSSFGSSSNPLETQFNGLSLGDNGDPFQEVRRDDFGPHKKGVWRILPVNANKVVTACYDHMARIFNIDDHLQAEGNNPLVLQGHKREVLSLACQGQTLITGSSDGQMFCWDKTTGERSKGVIREAKNQSTGFYSIALLPNQTIATGACHRPKKLPVNKIWEHNIKIWDRANGRLKAELRGHEGGIASLELVGNLLVSASGDRTIRLWNGDTNALVSIFDKAHEDYIYSIAALDDHLIASGARDRKIKIWNLETGKAIANFCMGSESVAHLSTVYNVAAFQEHLLLSGSRDGCVKVWDLRLEKSVKTLDADGHFVYSVAGLEDGRIAAGVEVTKEKSDTVQSGLRVWEFKH